MFGFNFLVLFPSSYDILGKVLYLQSWIRLCQVHINLCTEFSHLSHCKIIMNFHITLQGRCESKTLTCSFVLWSPLYIVELFFGHFFFCYRLRLIYTIAFYHFWYCQALNWFTLYAKFIEKWPWRWSNAAHFLSSVHCYRQMSLENQVYFRVCYSCNTSLYQSVRENDFSWKKQSIFAFCKHFCLIWKISKCNFFLYVKNVLDLQCSVYIGVEITSGKIYFEPSVSTVIVKEAG